MSPNLLWLYGQGVLTSFLRHLHAGVLLLRSPFFDETPMCFQLSSSGVVLQVGLKHLTTG